MNGVSEIPAEILAAGALTGVHVQWDPRPLATSPAAQAYLDARWRIYLAEARQAGRTLFDGSITRLISFRVEQSVLHLVLGPANFSTFFVTALRDHAWFAAHAPETIIGGLGNSVLLHQGQRCLLGIRSRNVAAYPRRAHIFGGVLDGLGTPDLPADIAGVLAHLRRELSEELGLVPADLTGLPRVLLLAWDPALQQPELIWQWELATPIEAVVTRLHQDEHTGHLIVDQDQPVADSGLTPCARLAVDLWRAGCPI